MHSAFWSAVAAGALNFILVAAAAATIAALAWAVAIAEKRSLFAPRSRDPYPGAELASTRGRTPELRVTMARGKTQSTRVGSTQSAHSGTEREWA